MAEHPGNIGELFGVGKMTHLVSEVVPEKRTKSPQNHGLIWKESSQV